jgi:hypothetical protein
VARLIAVRIVLVPEAQIDVTGQPCARCRDISKMVVAVMRAQRVDQPSLGAVYPLCADCAKALAP